MLGFNLNLGVQMDCIDFARSFLFFGTDRVNHTPRMQLDAVCTLRDRSGAERRFVLTCPCVGENMYVHEGLVQSPGYDFLMIAEPDKEFAIYKRGANSALDVHEGHRMGEAMSTHSGVPAHLRRVDITVQNHTAVEPITTPEDFKAALRASRPMVCRTTYTAPDGATTVVMEYPAKIINAKNDTPNWQIDTGPILIPDHARAVEPLAMAFDLAFIVFNRWDYAEIIRRRPTAVGKADDLRTTTYSEISTLDARNEVYAVT